jgi:hypothetical protein
MVRVQNYLFWFANHSLNTNDSYECHFHSEGANCGEKLDETRKTGGRGRLTRYEYRIIENTVKKQM